MDEINKARFNMIDDIVGNVLNDSRYINYCIKNVLKNKTVEEVEKVQNTIELGLAKYGNKYKELVFNLDLANKNKSYETKVKKCINNLQNDNKHINENNCIEVIKSLIKEMKERPLELYQNYALENRYDVVYTKELAEYYNHFFTRKLENDIDAFKNGNQLLEDIENNRLNILEVLKQCNTISQRYALLNFWKKNYWTQEPNDKMKVEKNSDNIVKDGEYFANIYDKFVKLQNKEATKEDLNFLSNDDYLKEVEKQAPKRKMSLKIKQFFQNIKGKMTGKSVGLLMTPEELQYRDRKDSINYAHIYVLDRIKEYDLSKIGKSDFRKSLEFESYRDNEAKHEDNEKTGYKREQDEINNNEPEL